MLTEDRVLESIEFFPRRQAVNALWKDRIIKDGVVIHEADHRGAFQVGEALTLSEAATAALGESLYTLMDTAVTSAVRNERDNMLNDISQREGEIEALADENGVLRAQVEALQSSLSDSESELLRLREEAINLSAALQSLQSGE